MICFAKMNTCEKRDQFRLFIREVPRCKHCRQILGKARLHIKKIKEIRPRHVKCQTVRKTLDSLSQHSQAQTERVDTIKTTDEQIHDLLNQCLQLLPDHHVGDLVPVQRVSCDLCNKLFKNKNSLQSHRYTIHKKKNDVTDQD